MNEHILEKVKIVSAIIPINIGTARDGDWVSMKNYNRCAIVVFGAAGPAGDDPVITVTQGRDVAEASALALTFTRVDVNQIAALTSQDAFTQVTQVAANTYSNLTLAETQKLIVIDIKAEDLADGYDCVRVSIGDAGTATQLAAALYLLHDPRYSDMPSAIVD